MEYARKESRARSSTLDLRGGFLGLLLVFLETFFLGKESMVGLLFLLGVGILVFC